MLAYALTAGRRAGVPGLSAARARGRALSQTVRLVFVDTDGSEIPVDAAVGKSLLEVAHANDIELEGACDGSLACSTCHLILDEESFKKLQPPGEEELDMLDLAFDLQKTCAPPPGGRQPPVPAWGLREAGREAEGRPRETPGSIARGAPSARRSRAHAPRALPRLPARRTQLAARLPGEGLSRARGHALQAALGQQQHAIMTMRRASEGARLRGGGRVLEPYLVTNLYTTSVRRANGGRWPLSVPSQALATCDAPVASGAQQERE